MDEAAAKRLAKAPLLIVQDLFPSPLSDLATYILPGAAFAEREGSYVNRRDHLQSFRRAVRPPAGVRPEAGLLWELLARQGLYNAQEVLHEVAVKIPYFRAAAGPVPETGVNLKINLLAESPANADRSMT